MAFLLTNGVFFRRQMLFRFVQILFRGLLEEKKNKKQIKKTPTKPNNPPPQQTNPNPPRKYDFSLMTPKVWFQHLDIWRRLCSRTSWEIWKIQTQLRSLSEEMHFASEGFLNDVLDVIHDYVSVIEAPFLTQELRSCKLLITERCVVGKWNQCLTYSFLCFPRHLLL